MTTNFDIREHNRNAWNKAVRDRVRWTIPVSSEEISRARQGDWGIVLTPTKIVPRAWFGDLKNTRVLCLAGAGGQQGPILAAAGANVTVFDNSPDQLKQDESVAEREGLLIETVEGDMRDLSSFADQSFDLVFHPCSNCFVPNIRPVWNEAYRVLRDGGVLLSGFCNPLLFIFDEKAMDEGRLEVRHSIPYSDLTNLDESELQDRLEKSEALSFGHTLEDQIGGQTDAGFVITDFFEDSWAANKDKNEGTVLSEYIAAFGATRSVLPQ